MHQIEKSGYLSNTICRAMPLKYLVNSTILHVTKYVSFLYFCFKAVK